MKERAASFPLPTFSLTIDDHSGCRRRLVTHSGDLASVLARHVDGWTQDAQRSMAAKGIARRHVAQVQTPAKVTQALNEVIISLNMWLLITMNGYE